MRTKSFFKYKFRSMLLTGTFTVAVIYIMLLCDNIIAGHFLGENGVSAINLVTPATGVVTFLSCIVSMGSGILYSRHIGEMDQKGADQVYGQGLIVSLILGGASFLVLMLGQNLYLDHSGVQGTVRDLAASYFRFVPLNSFLTIMIQYLSNMVYTDGDETFTNISYGLQIGGNVVLSVLLCSRLGMVGIILGTVIGNALGIAALLCHFFTKTNTLHFVRYFNWKTLLSAVRFSAVDSSIYLCWAVVDYVLIRFVSGRYGKDTLVVLAVVISLVEFCVVLDGVGMAIQPLIGTYRGEKNHPMIRRLMKEAIKAAAVEGIAANLLIFLLAPQFCALFGISGGAVLVPAVKAVRIVSYGLLFCGFVSLSTSYYMLVDHIGLATGITVMKDGLFYCIFPILGSLLFGENGLWAGFVAAPVIALILSFAWIRIHYGKDRFPDLLPKSGLSTLVLEDELTPESAVRMSESVGEALRENGFPQGAVTKAALLTEEMGLTILEKNKKRKKPLLIELSLLFDAASVLLVERDSGEIFDMTDADMEVGGLSSFVTSSLFRVHKDKAYLTTTGYNRNTIRFLRNGTEE